MRMMLWLGSGLWLVSGFGCGDKGAPAMPTAAPQVEVAGGQTPEQVAPVVVEVERPKGVTPEVDAAVAVGEDAAPASEVAADIAPASEVTVDAVVALSPAGVAAQLAAVTWLPQEVVARAATGTPGCVGISKNGKQVLSVVSVGAARELRLADFGTEDHAEKAWPLGTDAPAGIAAALSDETLVLAAKDKGFGLCAEVFGDKSFVIPKEVPVQVTADFRSLQVGVEGNRPVLIDLRDKTLTGSYYAVENGAVYFRINDATGPLLEVVNAPDLGQTACVPRPLNGKPLVTTVPPPFDPAPPESSCVAMSADGTAAAFKIWSTTTKEGDKDEPNHIEWFGPGAKPAIDLSCMARKCKPAEQATLAEAAARAGIVGCAVAKGAVAVDGMLTPFIYSNDVIRFQGGSGYRTVHRFSAPFQEEPQETLWKVFQLPTGGPIYLYVGAQYRYEKDVGVVVLDEAKLGLCERAAGTLKVVEVKASVSARDGGGYKYGAGQLVDGDPTTAWRPGVPKKGVSASVELVLDGEHEVSGLEVSNGFLRKDGNGDLFAQYARVADLLVTFVDGSSEKASFTSDARGMTKVTFAPHRTTRVTLLVTSVHAGSKYPEDVALSEVRIIGQ